MFKRYTISAIYCAVVGAALLISLVTSPSPAKVTATPAISPSNPSWVNVLDDEFNSSGIPSHWSLYNGPYGSAPHNCAAPSQDSAPGDGYLYLTMSYLTSGKCGAAWYTGGMQISSAYAYPQQAITVRWRILPSADPAAVHSHHIVPMLWPSDPAYAWYQAEADYCESSSPTTCTTFLHDGTATNTSAQIIHAYTVDLTQWHTWRFEQAGNTLTVYLDNLTTPVWVYQGTTTTFPDAIRRLVLQQECASTCPSASYSGISERLQVDYVRIDVPASAVATPTLTPTLAPSPTSGPSPTVQTKPTATSAPCKP